MLLKIPRRKECQSNLCRNWQIGHEEVLLRKIAIKVKAKKLLAKYEKVKLYSNTNLQVLYLLIFFPIKVRFRMAIN